MPLYINQHLEIITWDKGPGLFSKLLLLNLSYFGFILHILLFTLKASAQGQHELALENIRRAKEMLHQIPKEVGV